MYLSSDGSGCAKSIQDSVLLFIYIAQVVVPIVWEVVYVRPGETRFKASDMVWAQSQVSRQS